jgi:tetratricopeptide (TPR) repeat protein
VERIHLKYRTAHSGRPPQPIRLEIPGWAGDASKMQSGNVPQPWHCNPFVEGSTYGLELIYPYDSECHIVNEGGEVRIEWDYVRDRVAGASGGEFVRFAPKHYLFNTHLDLQAPADHVLRFEPHPRFFTDESGTVPCPIIGNLQTQWWPKLFFVAFKAPLPGQRHIFRKGEAYAQIIVVPRRVSYEIEPMTAEEARKRSDLEATMVNAQLHIAEHGWHDNTGYEFNDKYKVLSRVFHMQGAAAVGEAIAHGAQTMKAALPDNLSIAEALAKAREFHREGRFAEARAICYEILKADSTNGESLDLLAESAMVAKMPLMAVECLEQAVAAHPASAKYNSHLGQAWLAAGKADDAALALERAVELDPRSSESLYFLADALSHQGRRNEATTLAEQAATLEPANAMLLLRVGMLLERCGFRDRGDAFCQRAVAMRPELGERRKQLAAEGR